jgi:transposase, IS5 family
LYFSGDHIEDFMDVFNYEGARRIADRNVLRKVGALLDWSLIFPLLKSGLNRSGLDPPGSDEIVLFKCLLIGQWHGFYRPETGRKLARAV